MDFPRLFVCTYKADPHEDSISEAMLMRGEQDLIDLAHAAYISREFSAIQREGDRWTYHCANDVDKATFTSELAACLASLIACATTFDLLTLDEARAFVERRKALFPAHWQLFNDMPLVAAIESAIAQLEGRSLPDAPALPGFPRVSGLE